MINLSFLKSKPLEVKLPHGVDYFKLYFALRQQYECSYLFESLALPKQQDRYYTMGFSPLYIFSAIGQKLYVKGAENYEVITDNPYQELQKILPKLPAAKPHQGGLIGYLSYETANYFEPSLNLPEYSAFPAFELGLYADGLIYDSEIAELTYYTFYKDRSQEILDLINSLGSVKVSEKIKSVENQGHNISKNDFINSVEKTLDEIKKGNTFQAEVGFKTNYKIKGDKFAIYKHLRELNPSPYMYYLKFDVRELFGASPELVVSSSDQRVLTTPAAGTIKRGKTESEDKELARELLNDPKEIAEHNMLVDLHRNDISRVCKPGSVKVAKSMHLMKFSYVQHIVSDIIGELEDDKDAFDLLASILPCGVLTGAPKIETMQIIARNEKEPRGPYGGAVGRFSFSGDCAFCMPIRSLFCAADDCYTQTCAGIVFDSVPEREYDEVIHKLAGIEQAIKDVS